MGDDLAAIPNNKVIKELKEVVETDGIAYYGAWEVKSPQYYWIGNAGRWKYYENEFGGKWFDEVEKKSVSDCGAFSVKKFALGDCEQKLPFICQTEDNTAITLIKASDNTITVAIISLILAVSIIGVMFFLIHRYIRKKNKHFQNTKNFMKADIEVEAEIETERQLGAIQLATLSQTN